MAIINTGLLTKGLRSEFFNRFNRATTHFQDLTTRIQSNSDTETYKWLGSLPRMREWGTGRIAKGLGQESYSVENLKYESTLEVDRDGTARFNGRAHVRHEGAHVAHWPTEFLETAARRAHALDLAGHAGRYDNPMIMDLPAKTLSMGGHEIYDRYGAPDMGALYQTLDSLISLTDWQPAGH